MTGPVAVAPREGGSVYPSLSRTRGRARFAMLAGTVAVIAATFVGPVVTSAANLVDPVPAPHLEFGVATANPGPLTGVAGGGLNFQFHVNVLDASGQVITTGAGATTPVTLGLATNAAGAAVTCTGGLTTNAVAGVAN